MYWDNIFVRLIVAVVVVIIVVWLLGMTTLPSAAVAVLGLLAFFVVLFSDRWYGAPRP